MFQSMIFKRIGCVRSSRQLSCALASYCTFHHTPRHTPHRRLKTMASIVAKARGGARKMLARIVVRQQGPSSSSSFRRYCTAFRHTTNNFAVNGSSRRGIFIRASLYQAEKESTETEKKTEESETDTTEKEEKSEVEQLQEKLQVAEESAADFKEKYARSLAEMENIRQRAQRDVQNANKFAVQGFAKALLDVADNLERATKAVPEEKLSGDENAHLKALHDGVVLTEKTLQKIFEKHHVVKMNALNEKFDPNFHEGMFEFECTEREPGTVGQVIQEGWKLHERVIRPARVGTTKKPSA